MQKIDITALTDEQLKGVMADLGQPAFRAKQVKAWLQKGVNSFEEMTNLPKAVRERLVNDYDIPSVRIRQKWTSRQDETVKYVFELEDGQLIEAVFMVYHYGCSLCISTQAGCKMGCAFCATGLGGYRRNLKSYEMLGEIHAAQRDTGKRISHVVLMGMGEPLDNYDEVLDFLKKVSSPDGLNIGMRHISLSTCGLVDQIDRLREEKLQLTLSVSLHAPNDKIRDELMPVNHKWKVDELLGSCRQYIAVTGRRISFEYAMINGVNDSDACALELAGKLKGMLCHINLIPANEVRENDYRRSSRQRLERFAEILTQAGLNVTVRRSLGGDIDASCGQLRGRCV
nr:23S rRNA (adenine(2503)-C(2))-methyltransferase RlmN [uncultured Solibaculum sp.]